MKKYFDNGRAALMFAGALILMFLVMLMVGECVNTSESAEPVVIRVRDMGGPMAPGVNTYSNNPEHIVLSENFFSVQPGARQLRFGTQRLIPAEDSTPTTGAGIEALTVFAPNEDSTVIMYTSDNHWYYNTVGIVTQRFTIVTPTGNPMYWKDTFYTNLKVRPAPAGDSVFFNSSGDTVVGVNTRFIRDVQEGDSIIIGDTARVVDYVISDNKLAVTANYTTSSGANAWVLDRAYSDSVGAPFLHQSGEYLYTGTVADPPQVIYSDDNDTLRMRRMGIVDSFLIDSIYSLYGRANWLDTLNDTTIDSTANACWTCVFEVSDTTGYVDAAQGWAMAANNVQVIRRINLVNRRADWLRDQWFESVSENPEAYYLRLGFEHNGPFYQIAGNDDTSIQLMAWYVDSLLDHDTTVYVEDTITRSADSLSFVATGLTQDSGYWVNQSLIMIDGAASGDSVTVTEFYASNDSIVFNDLTADPAVGDSFRVRRTYVGWDQTRYFSKAKTFEDTIDHADAVGEWAYIYASAGASKPVVQNSSTGKLYVQARGGFMYTVDGSFPIDSVEQYKSMHFIRLIGNDIEFPAFSDSTSLFSNRYSKKRRNDQDAPTVPDGDTLLETKDIFGCEINRLKIAWYSTLEEALEHCSAERWSDDPAEDIIYGTEYIYYTARRNISTKDAEVFGRLSFPIQYMSHNGDTTFFINGTGLVFESEYVDSTTEWEIIKVDLPYWGGMTEWRSPTQLVAWGDTLTPSLVSFSGTNDPWNWSAQGDILIGRGKSDPIVSIVGYDDQLVIFKSHSIVGFNGARFAELSQTDGLAGRRAVVGLNKYLYWLDVDGVKMMQRRDFSGYSVQSISTPLDPVFNSWNNQYYGADVVPYRINPDYRYRSILVHNQRDQHLYVFFTPVGDSVNRRAAVYDLRRQQWDGVFTLTASDAIWATVRDTSRILMADYDSSIIYGLDYAWVDHFQDDTLGIAGRLRSGKFWVEDERGYPWESILQSVRVFARTIDGAIDTADVKMIGENATSTFSIGGAWATLKNNSQVFYNSTDNLSTYWQWELYYKGDSTGGNIFQPLGLDILLIPVRRDD